jgi:hypothetical protein
MTFEPTYVTMSTDTGPTSRTNFNILLRLNEENIAVIATENTAFVGAVRLDSSGESRLLGSPMRAQVQAIVKRNLSRHAGAWTKLAKL